VISGEQSATVVVLCHANVCRSPLAAYFLGRELAPFGWTVESRGTHARDGMRMCGKAAKVVARHDGEDYVETFGARRVTAADLAAPLILTASGAEKSELAMLDATTRRKTFTLREAADLSDLAAPGGSAEQLAEQWDALRRTGAIAAASSRGELDIPDVHMNRWVRHAPTIAAVIEVTDRIASGVRATRLA
jgi:protein-tyrosine phosphatase